MDIRRRNEDIAVSPVVGVILVVAITVALSVTIGVFVFDLGQSLGTTEAQSSVAAQIDERPDGVYVSIISTDSEVEVLKNGAVVHTFSETDVGATLKLTGVSDGDSVTLRKSGSSNSVVTSRTVKSSVPQSGDGAELVGGGSSEDDSTPEPPAETYTLAWSSESDWDAATVSAVEHSSRIDATSVRLGTLEDDGDVSEFVLGNANESDNIIEPASHNVVDSTLGLGQYARHVQSASTEVNYSKLHFNYSQERAPDKTVLWVNIPKPDTDDWVYNFGFTTAEGDTLTRISFDGYSGGDATVNVATLNDEGPGSGWNTRGDYPADTWFKVVVDWDWENDQFELLVDGTSRGTEGFRNGTEDGYSQYFELWDYSHGGLEGYVDHQTGLYADSGTLTTAEKTTPAPLNRSTLTLQNVTHTLNGQGITVTVESDPNGDGTFEETSDAIVLDGSESYDVTGLSADSDSFRLNAVMTSDNIDTPQLDSIELSGDEA